jgi:hypothetical protein
MLTAEERNTILDIKAVERELQEARREIRRLKIILAAAILKNKKIRISQRRWNNARRLVDSGRITTWYEPERRCAGIRIEKLLHD